MTINDDPTSWQTEPDDDLQQITPDMDEDERQHYLWKAIGFYFNKPLEYDIDTTFAKLVDWNLKNNPPFPKYELRDKNRYAWKKWTRK